MTHPVLVAGSWRPAHDPVGTFHATNPATREQLPDAYPISSVADVHAALEAGHEAALALRSVAPEQIADFLEQFADNIEARGDAIAAIGHLETALPEATRLRKGEMGRTTNQLRQAAAAARDRAWVNATIDTGTNIRSMLGPLNGPVVVFGPNNFPLAFNGISGGDFAAAIAAGNPVIAKANPAHPGTTRLLAEAAFDAVQSSGLPAATVQLLYHMPPEAGLELVSHPLVGATGFTGSQFAGLKLKEAADKAGKPIYLEMSSVNPVFILPGALDERTTDIAQEFYGSCSLAAGQFCTNPGLVILPSGDAGEGFAKAAADLFAQNAPGTLLSPNGPANIANALGTLTEHGAEVITGGSEADTPGYAFENTLLRTDASTFLANAEVLQTEAFGTVSLLVFADDAAQMAQIADALDGNLTGSIYTDTNGADDDAYTTLEPTLRPKVGRLLNDKMPTGVAVVPAMNHGGPFPSTGHPGFTAVGIPASLVRFAALQSYDNVRPHRLPPELQDKNPTGTMWRSIDGVWTQDDV